MILRPAPCDRLGLSPDSCLLTPFRLSLCLSRSPFVPFRNAFRREQSIEREALLQREKTCALADEEDVRGAFHDAACQGGRVTNILDGCNGAAVEGAAVHHAGVQGDRADAIRQSAVANAVDGGIVFNGLSTGERGVQCGLTLTQKGQGGAHGGLTEGPGGDNGEGHGVLPKVTGVKRSRSSKRTLNVETAIIASFRTRILLPEGGSSRKTPKACRFYARKM